MSDDETMTEVVVEEATNQLDAEGLVNGESVGDQLDSAEVGRAVGVRLGEAAGQRIGAAIGRRVHEALAAVDAETRPGDLGRDLATAVRNGFTDALADSRERGLALAAIADALQDPDVRSQIQSIVGEEKPTDGEREGESEAEEEAEPKTEETAEGAPLEDIEAEDLDVDDLEALQTETLEAYLQSISYRNLQSIAKEVDVTANITHEEMADRIVDAVTGDDES